MMEGGGGCIILGIQYKWMPLKYYTILQSWNSINRSHLTFDVVAKTEQELDGTEI